MSCPMVSDAHLSFLFLPQMNWVSIRRQVFVWEDEGPGIGRAGTHLV